jgi:hypothetical protein
MNASEFIIALANSSVGTTVAVFGGIALVVIIIAVAVLIGVAQADRRTIAYLQTPGPPGPPGPMGPQGPRGRGK